MDPARRASLEALATAVHVMSSVVKGAIGVGTTAASLSISMAHTAVLTGIPPCPVLPNTRAVDFLVTKIIATCTFWSAQGFTLRT